MGEKKKKYIYMEDVLGPCIPDYQRPLLEKLWAEYNTTMGELAQTELAQKKASKSYVNQWTVTGSKGNQYVVSQRGDGEFECSCRSWTTTVPREDCKHILRKKLELMQQNGGTITVKKTTVEIKQGRKFR